MSHEDDQSKKTGQAPASKTDKAGSEPPQQNDNLDAYFSKFSAILSKEIGLSADKFRDLQENNTPSELFAFLENAKTLGLSGEQPRDNKGKFTGKSKNPPITVYPQGNEIDKLPGTPMGDENLTKGEKFRLHRGFPAKLLFGNQVKRDK